MIAREARAPCRTLCHADAGREPVQEDRLRPRGTRIPQQEERRSGARSPRPPAPRLGRRPAPARSDPAPGATAKPRGARPVGPSRARIRGGRGACGGLVEHRRHDNRAVVAIGAATVTNEHTAEAARNQAKRRPRGFAATRADGAPRRRDRTVPASGVAGRSEGQPVPSRGAPGFSRRGLASGARRSRATAPSSPSPASSAATGSRGGSSRTPRSPCRITGCGSRTSNDTTELRCRQRDRTRRGGRAASHRQTARPQGALAQRKPASLARTVGASPAREAARMKFGT